MIQTGFKRKSFPSNYHECVLTDGSWPMTQTSMDRIAENCKKEQCRHVKSAKEPTNAAL